MNTTKHTPGPWATSRDAVPDYHMQITVYAESDGERVATAFRTEANANLIAAAPELLEAMEWIVEEQSHGEHCHRRTSVMCECTCWKSKAYAAIAKAKGNQ